MFVDDQPFAPTPLPNGGVPTVHFQLATALLLGGEVERDARPSNVTVARQLQVIFRRQLHALAVYRVAWQIHAARPGTNPGRDT